MQTVKSRVFNNLTKAQKSELCHYLSKFTKKHFDKPYNEIIDLYIEEEQYYLDINSSRHPWIEDFIDDEIFIKEVELFVKDQIKKLEIKEKQKPYIEKQKQLQKEQRKKAQEFKMSKEPPTKAQLSYYKSLCKKYKIEKSIDVENSSKLDLKNAIGEILDSNKEKELNLEQLAQLQKRGS